MARRSRSRQRADDLSYERRFRSGPIFEQRQVVEPEPALEDEAPQERPARVAHARADRRPGVEGPVDFFSYRDSLRR